MNRFFLLLFVSFTSLSAVQAQLGFGFKAGLNFGKHILDNPETFNGEAVERMEFTTGFHIGAAMKYPITDLIGVKWDILFSQKSSRYRYEGPSHFSFPTTPEPTVLEGNRFVTLNIINSEIDIPVMAYAKIGDRIMVGAGANVGFIVLSKGDGEVGFYNMDIDTFKLTLDNNYGKDEAGGVATESGQEPRTVTIGNTTVDLPGGIGAYYELDAKTGNAYNRMDFGLVADLSLFFNESLYFGLRANYGLLDITFDEMDYSLLERTDDNQLIKRADKDKYISLQLSLGFNF